MSRGDLSTRLERFNEVVALPIMSKMPDPFERENEVVDAKPPKWFTSSFRNFPDRKNPTPCGDARRSGPPYLEKRTLDFRSDAFDVREIIAVTQLQISTQVAGLPVGTAESPGDDH